MNLSRLGLEIPFWTFAPFVFLHEILVYKNPYK